jgi:hypothetical protein
MKKLIKTGLLLSLVSLSMLPACRKAITQTTAASDVANVATDDVEADGTFTQVSNDVSGVSDDIGFAGTEVGNDITPANPLANHCYTVTIAPLTAGVFPKTVTIDFGTGCLCKDGRTRKGKIIAIFTGRLKIPGSKVTATFDGYYVNNVHVEGTLVIDNNSTADIKRFTRTVIDGKLSKPNGNYISWNANFTATQTTGLGTPNYYWDDEFDITGNASGQTNRSGNIVDWTRAIDQPLHKKVSCKWFDKGSVAVTINSKSGVIDFGNGTCDNKATITYNGITKEITLP